MDVLIQLCIVGMALAACVAVCLGAMKYAGAAQARVFAAHEANFNRLIGERHWHAENSVEAKMTNTLTASMMTLSNTVEQSQMKLMAYTQEGRDHARMLAEIQVLKESEADRRQQLLAMTEAVLRGKMTADLPMAAPAVQPVYGSADRVQM